MTFPVTEASAGCASNIRAHRIKQDTQIVFSNVRDCIITSIVIQAIYAGDIGRCCGPIREILRQYVCVCGFRLIAKQNNGDPG